MRLNLSELEVRATRADSSLFADANFEEERFVRAGPLDPVLLPRENIYTRVEF